MNNCGVWTFSKFYSFFASRVAVIKWYPSRFRSLYRNTFVKIIKTFVSTNKYIITTCNIDSIIIVSTSIINYPSILGISNIDTNPVILNYIVLYLTSIFRNIRHWYTKCQSICNAILYHKRFCNTLDMNSTRVCRSDYFKMFNHVRISRITSSFKSISYKIIIRIYEYCFMRNRRCCRCS